MSLPVKHTKLRLINCAGYGLQQDDSLDKIDDIAYQTTTGSPVVYLLDINGAIKCTVPTSKVAYERPDNFDRRSTNVANHFLVLWDGDGGGCTIYHNPPRKKFDIPAAVGALAGFLLGLIVSSLIWSHKTNTEEVSTETATTEATRTAETTDSLHEKAGQTFAQETEKLAQTQLAQSEAEELQIKDTAYNWKHKLQSIDCTMSMVKSVERWYRSLDSRGRDVAERFYPFERALNLYLIFFTTRNFKDMRYLFHEGKSVFSRQQLEIIKWYGTDEKQFHYLRKRHGRAFAAPYEDGFIRP